MQEALSARAVYDSWSELMEDHTSLPERIGTGGPEGDSCVPAKVRPLPAKSVLKIIRTRSSRR